MLDGARRISRPVDARDPCPSLPLLLRRQTFLQPAGGVLYLERVGKVDRLDETLAPHRQRLVVALCVIQRGRRAVAQLLTHIVKAQLLDLGRELEEHAGCTFWIAFGQIASEQLALGAITHERDGLVDEGGAPVDRDGTDGLPAEARPIENLGKQLTTYGNF